MSGISDQVNRLQNKRRRTEFETCQSWLQIIDKLNQGLTDQKLDQGFANDILKDIATAVGVPVEPAEISKELESFKREKEAAANRKETAEVYFLEQVIELLSLERMLLEITCRSRISTYKGFGSLNAMIPKKNISSHSKLLLWYHSICDG